MKNNVSIFTEENGSPSMRRVLSFLLVLTSIGFGIMSLLKGMRWSEILVLVGSPLVGAIILLFFTTWEDVANVLDKIRK